MAKRLGHMLILLQNPGWKHIDLHVSVTPVNTVISKCDKVSSKWVPGAKLGVKYGEERGGPHYVKML